MPSKKKAKGKAKGKGAGDRQLLMAKRADKLPLDALPPFPGPETPEQAEKRILGYKYLCNNGLGGDNPVSITRKGSAFQIKEFSNDMKLEKSFDVQVLDDEIMHKWVADYDRNKATYPVAMKLIAQREGVDIMARRARKHIEDVPPGDEGVFLKFVQGGEEIAVQCVREEGGYKISVSLVEEGCSFNLRIGGNNVVTSFRGCFSEFCLEQYQKDLAFYLMYESLVRVSSGAAEIEGDIDRENLVLSISEAFRRFCTYEKEWKNHVVLNTFLLDKAIEDKESLNTTVAFEGQLGEALEACGFYSQAALLYEEGGDHLYRAGHRQSAVVWRNAGIAWKRHGDYENAERCYARALHALLFQHDHVDYRSEAFGILRSLFLVYDDPAKIFVPVPLVVTLQALILAAGGKLPGGRRFPFLGAVDAPPIPILREAYSNASQEQMCGVLQSVITRSTSVEGLRKAIMSCGRRGISMMNCEITDYGEEKGNKDLDREFLEESREYIQGNYKSTGIMAACSACGELKEVKSLARCSGCNNEYYCDKVCQRNHWRSGHKATCKSSLRKMMAQCTMGN